MKDKEYVIKHRAVGEPDQEPAETTLFADSPDEAKSKFWKYYWDLNAHIVSVKLLKCEVKDLGGNHCPELVEYLVWHNEKLINLCLNCYTNILNGAYKE